MTACREILVLAGVLALAACATTARMHNEAELNNAATRCGFALGQLAQDEEEKKLLFIMEANPSAAKQVCVKRWAKQNGLKPVFIDAVDWVRD